MNGDMLDTKFMNDIWIAATAISRQCRLITYEAHFKSVDGLDVVC